MITTTTPSLTLEIAIDAALQDNPLLEKDPNRLYFQGAQAELATVCFQGQRYIVKCPKKLEMLRIKRRWEREAAASRVLEALPEELRFNDNDFDRPVYLIQPFHGEHTLADLIKRRWSGDEDAKKRYKRVSRGSETPQDILDSKQFAAVALYDLFLQARENKEQELIHRDFKPSNAVITEEGFIRVVDWGLVISFAQAIEDTEIVGSLEYKAPEQEEENRDQRFVDFYSLGLVVHDLLLPQRRVQMNPKQERAKRWAARREYEGGAGISMKLWNRGRGKYQTFSTPLGLVTMEVPSERERSIRGYLENPATLLTAVFGTRDKEHAFEQLAEARQQLAKFMYHPNS